MYLSRIELDENKRETTRAIGSPGIIHGAVESSIDGVRERNLWRIDRFCGKCYLLILSRGKPNLERISSQFGKEGDAGEIKDYDALISRIRVGQSWRFRLRGNPVHSEGSGKHGERGKVYAHVTTDQQKEWLLEKAEKNGFSVEPDGFDVVDTRWYKFAKHHGAKDTVTIRTATYEGVLTVTDAELFRAALQEGVGRAKVYGCGLLTLMSL